MGSGLYTVLLVAHTILVLFLIVLVLIQRTDSDGLSGLGGGGGNSFMTGRAKGSLMTRTTAILAALFMTTSMVLAVMASNETRSSVLDKAMEDPAQSAPVEEPAKPAEPVAPKTE